MPVTVIPASHRLPSEKMSRRRKNNNVILHFLLSYHRVWQTLFSTGSYPLVENHLNAVVHLLAWHYPHSCRVYSFTAFFCAVLILMSIYCIGTVENCQDSRRSHFVKGLQTNYTLHCYTNSNRPPTSREKKKKKLKDVTQKFGVGDNYSHQGSPADPHSLTTVYCK